MAHAKHLKLRESKLSGRTDATKVDIRTEPENTHGVTTEKVPHYAVGKMAGANCVDSDFAITW